MRKLKYVMYILLIGIVAFSFRTDEIMQTMSMGIKNNTKIIVIDPGHGGEDGGAISLNGVLEKELNLKISMKVKDILEQEGYTVILTRKEDSWVGNISGSTIGQRKREDINNRIGIVENSNADMLISIHMNKFEQEKYWGWQTFYKASCDKSKQIATYIQEEIKKVAELDNNRVAHEITSVKLINKATIPSVIVECGFLSNAEETNRLITDIYQEKIARGIVKGICKWYE